MQLSSETKGGTTFEQPGGAELLKAGFLNLRAQSACKRAVELEAQRKQNFCENPCGLALFFSTPDRGQVGVFAQQRAGMRLSTLENGTARKSDPLAVSTACRSQNPYGSQNQ